MKPFTFRLDRLLRYREHLEKKALLDLHRARTEWARRRGAIERWKRQREQVAAQCRERGAKGMEVALSQIYWAHLKTLRRHLEKGRREMEEAQKRVQSLARGVKEATMRKKSLEILREVCRQRFLREREREEQRNLDELLILRRRTGP